MPLNTNRWPKIKPQPGFPNTLHIETFEERQILTKYKKGDNFNRRNTLEYFEE